MFGGKIRAATVLGSVALALSGCASDIAQRAAWTWGPAPTMPADHANAVLDKQVFILNYIFTNANLAPGDFYGAAQWGFNVGRQDCETYMNVLFKLNREKGRNSSVITAVSTAVTGVVGVAASSPSTTLSILSAAFGLTSALNDAYFNTYLFSEAPGLVAAKVLDLQTSYANTIDRSKIKTPADAYGAIQKYYQLCLPESIEGVLLQAIADTQAKTTPPPAGQKDTPHQRTMLVPRRGLQ